MVFDNYKQAVWNKMETDYDKFTMKTRSRYEERWMKLCGVDDPKDIDLNNPIVNLEYFLADFRIISRLTSGKRDEVLAMMTEQQR